MAFRLLLRCACAAALTLAAAWAPAATMVFVMDPFPPFTYEVDGQPAGAMSDTIRAVCASLRIECQLKSYPWRRALKLAEDGEVDGIYALAPIAEREQFFYLTPPIVQSAYGVFVTRGSPLQYTTPHDLDGYTVAAYGPSAASRALEQVAQQASGVNVQIEIDNVTLLRKLQSGRYGEHGAAVANVDVGRHLMREHGLADLRVAGLTGKTEYAIGLSRKKVSPPQAEAFMAALAQLTRAGKVRQIVEREGLQPASP